MLYSTSAEMVSMLILEKMLASTLRSRSSISPSAIANRSSMANSLASIVPSLAKMRMNEYCIIAFQLLETFVILLLPRLDETENLPHQDYRNQTSTRSFQ